MGTLPKISVPTIPTGYPRTITFGGSKRATPKGIKGMSLGKAAGPKLGSAKLGGASKAGRKPSLKKTV